MTLQTQLTDKQVAAKIGISVPTVWRWSREGRLPAPRKLGQQITRWSLREIEEFLGETPNAA